MRRSSRSLPQWSASLQRISFVGRGPGYPIALEGALKMKEISYIHAEDTRQGRLHGPLPCCRKTPVVAICPPGDSYGVMISNIREMKARNALILLGEQGDRDLIEIADVFILPGQTRCRSFQHGYSPVAGHHTANALDGISMPRNLAKSLTV